MHQIGTIKVCAERHASTPEGRSGFSRSIHRPSCGVSLWRYGTGVASCILTRSYLCGGISSLRSRRRSRDARNEFGVFDDECIASKMTNSVVATLFDRSHTLKEKPELIQKAYEQWIAQQAPAVRLPCALHRRAPVGLVLARAFAHPLVC